MTSPPAQSAHPTVLAALVVLATASLFATVACGVEGRQAGQTHEPEQADSAKLEAAEPDENRAKRADPSHFEWPAGPHPIATLKVRGLGEIRIALYTELAPKAVESFTKLAAEGLYDGTTFHRVIPGFMIQGGDPNTKNDDPRDDGRGGPDLRLPDEFGPAPHLRGTVALANTGRPNTSGSQFFIVHQDARHLDGRYSVIGRVLEGMEVVDTVAAAETDRSGQWGPKDRPLEDIVIERLRVEAAGD